MKRLTYVAVTLGLLVCGCLATEGQFAVEIEADHLVVRNYSNAAHLLDGGMINDRTDCYLVPVVRRSDGVVVLVPPEALSVPSTHLVAEPTPGTATVLLPMGEVDFSLEPYALRVGESVELSFEHSPCVAGASRAIRFKVIFDDGEFGSFVEFPIPPAFSRP